MNLFKSKLKLVKGTRFVSFLFIGVSVAIAAGILWAANMYYNIDTGEVVVEEIKRVTGVLRATGGAIVGGTATQNPATGYGFEVSTSTLFSAGDVVLSAANQLLKFTGGTNYYVGFKATTTLAATSEYIWPTALPPGSGYYLSADPSTGQMSWGVPAGAGDVTDVGDCPSGACFTADGAGNTLWFEGTTADANEIILTAADPTTDYTITLPAANGYVALGSSTANYVAYWTGTHTLAGEQYLSTTRGGTGQNTSAWSGMIKVVGGTWATTTGTANYAAYWSDANTVAAEQYLALSRGGTGRGSWKSWGVVYAPPNGALDNTEGGSTFQILTANTGAAPIWRNISTLVTATNGLTITQANGGATITLNLGGALATTTTITQGNYDMIFNLTGTGDFKVQDNGVDILTVTDDGKIYFKTYPLAESGKQILREMIPILGFDLPVQTATTSYVKISKTLENYPFAAASTGSTRVHKLVFRYAASTTNPIEWRVSTTTGQTYSSSTLPAPTSNSLEQGNAYITTTTIPTDGTDWWLEVKTATIPDVVRIFQIFLAAYDQIQ